MLTETETKPTQKKTTDRFVKVDFSNPLDSYTAVRDDYHAMGPGTQIDQAMGYLLLQGEQLFLDMRRAELDIARHCLWIPEWNQCKSRKREALGAKSLALTINPDTFHITFEADEVDENGPLLTHTLETVIQKKVKWLDPNRIPYGYVTVIAGETGVGKSTITCFIMAKMTQQRGHDALLIADEDNDDDTLVPRLNAADADLSKVHHMKEMAWKDDKKEGFAFEIKRDADKLRSWLIRHPRVKVVVIDPWLNYMGRGNSNSTQDVRSVLMPLQAIARDLGIAILAIAHFKKGSAEKANERISGSAAIIQVPRSVLLCATVKEENGVTYGEMHQTKHNLNPQGKGKQYRIVGAVSKRNGVSVSTSKVVWDGESQKNAEALFASKDPQERSLDLCCEWLANTLNGRKHFASEVLSKGESKGFSTRTIYRALGTLKGNRDKEEGTNRAIWWLS